MRCDCGYEALMKGDNFCSSCGAENPRNAPESMSRANDLICETSIEGDFMKTSHEVQVEIREKILPLVRDLNDQVRTLYQESVSPLMGLQGIHGPESDISIAYQLLDGAKNMMKSIAGHFGLPVADRD